MSIEEQTRAAHDEWRELLKRGPIALTWETLPPQVGDAAPDLELDDFDGKRRRVSEFWADAPALILFWRHQGCSCGYARADRLAHEYDEYVEAGANVVVIGQAEPERAKKYAEDRSIPCTVLCDPDYQAYRAYGLREGTIAQVVYDAPEEYWGRDFEVWQDFIEQREKDNRPFVDNPWLLPSEFVVGTDGKLKLAYHYNFCEDYPDPQVLVAAIKTTVDEREERYG